MSQPINVTSAIILRETSEGVRVLVARRKLDTKLEAGKWEFPGGKLEAFEHPRDGLKREILEELGLDIQVGELFDLTSHIYETAGSRVHVLLMSYLCTAASPEFQLLDVSDARWVSASELAMFDWAAADVVAVEKLRAYLDR